MAEKRKIKKATFLIKIVKFKFAMTVLYNIFKMQKAGKAIRNRCANFIMTELLKRRQVKHIKFISLRRAKYAINFIGQTMMRTEEL